MSSNKETKPFVSREEGGKARRGKKTADKSPEYIPHETIPAAAQEQPKVAEPIEVVPLPDDPQEDEKRKKLEIAKLGVAETGIAELKAKYGELVINGIEDKEGYKVVKAAWSEVRSVRTGLEKKGVAIRSKINEISKAVGKEEDRLVGLISPLEEDLQKKWKEIDEQKEREQREKEQKEHERLLARINKLIALGMTLRDGFYRIGETISMDVATLRALPDEQFKKLEKAVKVAADILADEEREKEAAAQKERDRVKAEQDKLRQEQEDLEKEKQQIREGRREVRLGKLENLGMAILAEDPEVIAFGSLRLYTAPLLDMTGPEFDATFQTTKQEIDRRKTRDIRHKQLTELELELDRGQYYYDNDFNEPKKWPQEYLLSCSEEIYTDELKAIAEDIELLKQAKIDHEAEKAEEKRLLEIKEQYIAKAMEIAGLNYSYNDKRFFFKNDQGDLTITWNDLITLDENAITLKAQELGNQVIELKRKSDEARKAREKKEKEDNAALMGDSERWTLFVTDAVSAAPDPSKFKTKPFQVKAQAYLDFLTNSVKS